MAIYGVRPNSRAGAIARQESASQARQAKIQSRMAEISTRIQEYQGRLQESTAEFQKNNVIFQKDQKIISRIDYFSALRVPSAVTRLTVYRRLTVISSHVQA